MKIVCISDTHGLHRKFDVPDGDILLHAGDLTNKGEFEQIADVNDWLGTLPHPHKVVIAGNHDFSFEKEPERAETLLSNAVYLRDETFEVGGLKIYGSPWQPWFYDWAFNLKRGSEIREKWDAIPIDTDILVTHGPPAGILDETVRGDPAGCEDLMNIIRNNLSLKLHVFGHIHEAYGKEEVDGTTFVNASICTLRYQPKNPPIVVELNASD